MKSSGAIPDSVIRKGSMASDSNRKTERCQERRFAFRDGETGLFYSLFGVHSNLPSYPAVFSEPDRAGMHCRTSLGDMLKFPTGEKWKF